MSQLLILGNGFDLQCGLKSSYKDFFRSSIFDAEQSEMKQGCDGFWEQLLFNYYMKFGNDDYNWCDIENIIKQTLWDINFCESHTSSPNPLGGIWDDDRKYDPNAEAKKKILHFVSFTYAQYHNFYFNFGDTTYEQTLLLNAHLLQELKNFESRFCKYIKELIVDPSNEKNLNEKYIINASNLLAKLTDFTNKPFESIEDVIEDEDEKYWIYSTPSMATSAWRKINVLNQEFKKLNDISILSFNYTALFDILKVDSPWLYSNVHGKICLEKCSENCTSSTVIFGIDDTVIQSQKSNYELRFFSKTYRKMSNTCAPISILPPNNGEPLSIKFYGHSLSDADYSYFQKIFDYYNIYNNSNIELIFYYSKGFEQTDAIYRLMNTYGTTLTNQQQGKNLMHKLLLENRLKIIEISLHS